MTKSTYRVDPIKDLSFAREFMETPVGLHSAGLQRVLNVFRGEPLAGKYVLVEIEPHRQWRLARLTGERGRPVLHLDTVFTDCSRPNARFSGCAGWSTPATTSTRTEANADTHRLQ